MLKKKKGEEKKEKLDVGERQLEEIYIEKSYLSSTLQFAFLPPRPVAVRT